MAANELSEYVKSYACRKLWDKHWELFGDAIVQSYYALAHWADERKIDTIIFMKDEDYNFSLMRDGRLVETTVDKRPNEPITLWETVSLPQLIDSFRHSNYKFHWGILTILKIDPTIQKYVKVVDEDNERIVVKISQTAT